MKVSSFTILIIFLFFYSSSFSQSKNTGRLKGKITDTTTVPVVLTVDILQQQIKSDTATKKRTKADSTLKESLKGATIAVLNPTDFSLVTYDMSEQDGSFEVHNIPYGTYLAVITYLGFEEINITFSVTVDKKEHNTGTFYLERKTHVMEEIVIKAVAVIIKGDTTEFNANLFKTIPNNSDEPAPKATWSFV